MVFNPVRSASRLGLAAVAAATIALHPAAAQQGASGAEAGPLTIARQGSFFVGGRDVTSDTLSTLPAYAPEGTITVDQMYVRYQVPVGGDGHVSLTLIHGCCLTGKTWETTPDGRMGWDEYFVRHGYPTYVVDQAWRGRSAASIAGINAVRTARAGVDQLPTVFAAGHEPAWAIFRFGPKYPDVFPGMQFPLQAQGEFWKQMVPDWLNALPSPNPTIAGLSELSRRVGRNILVSHSQSGIFPFQTAALNREGIAGIVAVEPGACPAADGDMKPYAGLPVLVLFGDYVELSPRWAPRLVACRAFVAATNAAGGKAELLVLPDIGIRGNSHMLMQDRNSLELAALLDRWMQQHVGAK